MDWYRLDVAAVFESLQSSKEGLSPEEAARRLEEHGPNKLVEEEKISRLKIFVHQFTSPLIYILLVAAIVTAFLKEYKDMGVIIAVVVLNAVIGYIQEVKAEKNVRALKKMVVPHARVLRGGQEEEINSEGLVPGDIVLLASGAKVPADLRLIRCLELRIDEAMLTGESVPAEKQAGVIEEENLTPGDQRNMAFMGTVVVHGRGKGVVAGTAHHTVLGRIATDVKDVGMAKAPLQQKFDRFAAAIGFLTLGAAVVLFGAGVFVGESPKDMFLTAVAAAVATIPEGLPIVVTIALAIGVARMARRKAIIRKLPAVETLGSTTVICSDKTGTLTKNEMTVKQVYDGRNMLVVTGSGYEPQGEVLRSWFPLEEEIREEILMVFRIGLLCNESHLYEEEGEFKIDGDPTEGALIVSALKAGLNLEEEKEKYPQADMIPFESERGYMATLHQHGAKKLIFVKGAPERLLDICETCRLGQGEDFLAIAERLAQEGLRVMAMAFKEVPAEMEELTHADLIDGLIFAGLQGMLDPPRDEVVEAIKDCKKAGIRVMMITGDHAVTARTIGRKLGICKDDAVVLTGRELEAMADEDLYHRVQEVSVFARVAPHHKLRITEQLLKHGEIVAMTGDGVNDAPALKAVHIGVAMGKTGTDVAKEASDMVIADDNFSSIVSAVEEGRIVFDNIRKVTFFLIPTGIAAIISILITVFLGLPLPYLPAQLLWINLVSNGLQDVALAFEPGERDNMRRRPRHPQEGIMSGVLIQRTIVVGMVVSAGVVFEFLYSLNAGDSLAKARTLAVTTMVFFQFFQAWNSRSERESIFRINPFSNQFLFFSMLAAFLAQLAFIYVPALQWIFRTEPLTGRNWVEIGLISLSVIGVVEIDKCIRRWREKRSRVLVGSDQD